MPQDNSPSITQDEEERLLASSHDSSADSVVFSIYAPVEFESDSVPCHALMEPEVPEEEVPPSHIETPTDQEITRRRFEEQGARPKSYRRQQEERWQLLSGEQMKLRITIQDVPTRESCRSDRHSSTRRPSGSHHRPSSSHQQSSTSRERPSTKSSSTSHQRSSTPRRQSSRSHSSPSQQSRGSYSDLKDRHSGKDTRRILDRRPSSSKSSTATSRYRSDQSDFKRGCSSVREEGKRSRYSASSNLSDRSEVHQLSLLPAAGGSSPTLERSSFTGVFTL